MAGVATGPVGARVHVVTRARVGAGDRPGRAVVVGAPGAAREGGDRSR